ncbi:hypothetical protein BaRGS_00011443 [Batillaria attramentaria]|uniref:Uncharacterized protein n=1 Tax=Batillaria attramentaria TaxID=370345 RepID=A0ABD0LCW3_9CAEN
MHDSLTVNPRMELSDLGVADTPSTKMSPEQENTDGGLGDGGDSITSQASWADFKPPMLSQMDRLLDDRYRHKNSKRVTLQVKVYNFLERPTGWKCFIYHFTV